MGCERKGKKEYVIDVLQTEHFKDKQKGIFEKRSNHMRNNIWDDAMIAQQETVAGERNIARRNLSLFLRAW